MSPPLREAFVPVCVIGSGAGGAVAAATLTDAGIETLLLEAGESHDASSFTQREGAMMARLYAEAGMLQTEDDSLVLLQGEGLGGSTLHNTALCVPPPRGMLERWAQAGTLAIPTEEVLAAADWVLASLGARDIPASDENGNNRRLREGAAALGLEVRRPLHNRTACSGCGFCILGCAYNRKQHVVPSFLVPATRAGLSIWTRARVHRIRREAGHLRVEGPGFVVRTEQVVLAASAVATPLILDRSGLGGRGVGQSLRLHPFAPLVAEFPDPVHAWSGVPQSVLVTHGDRADRGGVGGFVLMAAAAGPASVAALWPRLGSALREDIAKISRLGMAGVLLHDRTRGRVRGRRDGRPRIRYWPEAEDQVDLRGGLRDLARIWFAAGALRVLPPFLDADWLRPGEEDRLLTMGQFRPHRVVLSSVHPQGSVPLGPKETSALDGGGRVRAEPRIRVADGSLLPESIGVPPQVTIMSFARLITQGLVREARSGRDA